MPKLKKLFYCLSLSLMLVCLGGCATECTGGFHAEYIYPSRLDILTEGTREQILIHNEALEKYYGD